MSLEAAAVLSVLAASLAWVAVWSAAIWLIQKSKRTRTITTIRDAQAALQVAQQSIPELSVSFAALEKKHADLFALIDSIVAERNAIMEQYHRQAAEHATAQDMMLREIKHLGMQYAALQAAVCRAPDVDAARKCAARPLRLNPTLDAIAAEFREEHQNSRV